MTIRTVTAGGRCNSETRSGDSVDRRDKFVSRSLAPEDLRRSLNAWHDLSCDKFLWDRDTSDDRDTSESEDTSDDRIFE